MRARTLTLFEGSPKPGRRDAGMTTQYNDTDFVIEVLPTGSAAMVWEKGPNGEPKTADPVLIGGANIRFAHIDHTTIKPREPADKSKK